MRKARNSYVVQRGDGFVYKRDVPADLRAAVGKTAWWIALKASTPGKAEDAARLHARAHDAIIERLRADGASPPVLEQIAAIEAEVERSVEALRRDFFLVPRQETQLPALHAATEAMRLKHDSDRRRLIEKTLRYASSQVERMPPADRALIEMGGGVRKLFADREDAQRQARFLDAAEQMAPESEGDGGVDWIETREQRLMRLGEGVERQDGARQARAEAEADLRRTGRALQRVGLAPQPAGPPAGPTVSAVVEKWLSNQSQRPETERKWRVYVRRFVDVHGDIAVRAITKAMVRDYVETIALLPDSRGLKPALRGGTVQDLLSWKDGEDEVDLISAPTVTKHLDCMKAFLRWASRQDYIDSNPAQDIVAPRDKRSSETDVRPFTKTELIRITDAAAQQWGKGDDRYWALMAAVYTGARREEICQLAQTNLEQHDGRWFLQINDHDGRQIKNDSSIRTVPLHPDLIQAGFLAHAQKITRGPLLFSTMEMSAGRYGHKLGAAFSRLLRDHLGIADKAVRWHSCRHSFADACREADLPEDVRHRLMGHAGSNRIASGYGRGHSLEKLASWMEKTNPL